MQFKLCDDIMKNEGIIRMTGVEFIGIIQRTQGGDKKALGRIYDEYFGKLCLTALDIVKDKDLAYDIASDVVVKLLDFRYDAAQIKNHVGYLLTMVRNEAKNLLNKRSREICVAEPRETRLRELPDMLWAEDIFSVLSEKERELFILHIVWDMTLRRASELIGITYGAAKARYKIIKEKIRSVYKEED